jgi:hypothetical protein
MGREVGRKGREVRPKGCEVGPKDQEVGLMCHYRTSGMPFGIIL